VWILEAKLLGQLGPHPLFVIVEQARPGRRLRRRTFGLRGGRLLGVGGFLPFFSFFSFTRGAAPGSPAPAG